MKASTAWFEPVRAMLNKFLQFNLRYFVSKCQTAAFSCMQILCKLSKAFTCMTLTSFIRKHSHLSLRHNLDAIRSMEHLKLHRNRRNTIQIITCNWQIQDHTRSQCPNPINRAGEPFSLQQQLPHLKITTPTAPKKIKEKICHLLLCVREKGGKHGHQHPPLLDHSNISAFSHDQIAIMQVISHSLSAGQIKF